MKKILTLLLCIPIHFATAQNNSDRIELTDLLKIKNENNITSSTDGTKAAFTVTAIESDENSSLDYTYRTQIYTWNEENPNTVKQITSDKNGASRPAWSPDGKLLAFSRFVKDKMQIFVLSMEGGEATQLTNFRYGANNPKWSPDGKKILFSASISLQELLKDSILNPKKTVPNWNTEKPGFTSNDYLNSATIKSRR